MSHIFSHFVLFLVLCSSLSPVFSSILKTNENIFHFDSSCYWVPSPDSKTNKTNPMQWQRSLTYYNSNFYFAWNSDKGYKYIRIKSDGTVIDSSLLCLSTNEINQFNTPFISLAANKLGVYSITGAIYGDVAGVFFKDGKLTDRKWEVLQNNNCQYIDIASSDSTFLIVYNNINFESYHYSLINSEGKSINIDNNLIDEKIRSNVTVEFDGINYNLLYTRLGKMILCKISTKGNIISKNEITGDYNNSDTAVNYDLTCKHEMSYQNGLFYITTNYMNMNEISLNIIDTNGVFVKGDSFYFKTDIEYSHSGIWIPNTISNDKLYFFYPNNNQLMGIGCYDIINENTYYLDWHFDSLSTEFISGVYSKNDTVFLTTELNNNIQINKIPKFQMHKINNDNVEVASPLINRSINEQRLLYIGNHNTNYFAAFTSGKSENLFMHNTYSETGENLKSIKKESPKLDPPRLYMVEGSDDIIIMGGIFDSSNILSFSKSGNLNCQNTINLGFHSFLWGYKDGFASISNKKFNIYNNYGDYINSIPCPAVTFKYSPGAIIEYEYYKRSAEGDNNLLLQYDYSKIIG